SRAADRRDQLPVLLVDADGPAVENACGLDVRELETVAVVPGRAEVCLDDELVAEGRRPTNAERHAVDRNVVAARVRKCACAIDAVRAGAGEFENRGCKEIRMSPVRNLYGADGPVAGIRGRRLRPYGRCHSDVARVAYHTADGTRRA